MSTALTSLTNVKSWCAVTSSNDDTMLTRLIAQASRAVYAYLTTNTLFLTTFNDTYDGVNNTRLMLKEWPVLSIGSVYIDGANITAANQAKIVAGREDFELSLKLVTLRYDAPIDLTIDDAAIAPWFPRVDEQLIADGARIAEEKS